MRKLQSLLYDILPPTTAITDDAIDLQKLPANEHFFCRCSKFNGNKFVTETQIVLGVSVVNAHVAFASTNKTASFEWRGNSFLPGADAPHFKCVLGRYVSSTELSDLSEGADSVGGQLRGDKECPFSGVTNSGIAWRKVPESGVWCVGGAVSV